MCSTPNAAKIFLTKTKPELCTLSTSSNKWQEWHMANYIAHLYLKGFIPQLSGMNPSFNLLLYVVLCITASLGLSVAVTSDTLCTVGAAMDIKRVDHAVEGVTEDVQTILATVCAFSMSSKTPNALAGDMHTAAVQLMHTVDEQASALSTSAERL
jgi:hypothetical protein